MDMLLETKKVTKIFGGLHANSDIDFSIDEGEIVAIIGPNGSGKTTFYNVLTGISPATRGQIIFKGKSIEKMQPEAITRLGMARTFQNIRLFGNMTVAENIIIARHCRRKTGIWDSLIGSPRLKKEEAENQEYIKKCLEYVGIYDKKDWLAKNLPYGMQRRLEIARVLATEPSLILLDEPAAGMNPHEKEELVEITLQDDVLKVDGNMAIAWSGSLNFTVERSGKSLVGSAASGEGLVNVYRGTGRVLLAPVLNGAV